MKTKNKKNIILDFDGTCVKHAYPKIGDDIGAISVLQRLVRNHHNIILFTMRSMESSHFSHVEHLYQEENQTLLDAFDENTLEAAVNWFVTNNVKLYGIQRNPTQERWTNSPKAYGHCIIDDICFGIPLIENENERPYIDWITLEKQLEKAGYFEGENND